MTASFSAISFPFKPASFLGEQQSSFKNLFPSCDYVLTTDASESGAGATLKKGNNTIKTWSFQWSTTIEHVIKSSRNACAVNGVSSTMSETEQLQAEDSNRQHNNSLIQPPGWSDTGPICSVRTTLETMPQEENESQIIVQSNQDLQLGTEEGSVQSNPISVRSNPDGSVRISPEPSNEQLLNNQIECTPPRLESMEAMSGLPTTNYFTFYPGEDELIQFEEGFYNTDLPNLEISNLVSDDPSSSSSSSSSHVSSSSGNIPRSIDQTISRVNTNPNSTTLETGDYSTFQSHVIFRNFCTSNSLNPANVTLFVFMDYLTHLFKHKPPLAFSTINGHRSMLNQLLLLKNQTDIVNDPFITRIMTGIHKLRPSSAKYQEIWDANQVFKHLSTIKVIPKYTYTALLKKTLILCKMFGLAGSSDLVKWITVSSTVKNNDTDLLIVEKRINDSLKPLLLMSKLISYLAQSAIVLAVNAQASLSRVRRNNIAKEIYGSEVILPIDETETERVRKLAKSIRKNNETKQSLLKLNYHSKPNVKLYSTPVANETGHYSHYWIYYYYCFL
ncbi:hypothetical protein ACTFIR_007576 [Dictyostelium discoideum]